SYYKKILWTAIVGTLSNSEVRRKALPKTANLKITNQTHYLPGSCCVDLCSRELASPLQKVE
ncbi:MAG: hypothetical protein KDD22_02330, partial [Bdellovibrionales bacterium]|nr:hypothetical protein [Bdellovibrionales bacterium]